MSTAAEQEAIFGVAPVLKNEKKYGFIDALFVTGGFSIATWCYTQGAYMVNGLGFKELVSSIFGPNIIIAVLISFPAILAVRYGVDIWIWLRSVFGDIACKMVCCLIMVIQLPWYAVCANMFASSLMHLFLSFGVTLPEFMYPAMSMLCVFGGFLIAIGGPGVIKWSSRIMVTTLLLVGFVSIMVAFSAVPIAQIIGFVPPEAMADSREIHALMLEASTAFAISWCMSLTIIPRLCKSERGGYWATIASYGVIAPLFVLFGGIMAMALFIYTGRFSDDPAEILAVLSGPMMALLSLVFVAFANIGTAGVGTYMFSLMTKSSFPKVKFKQAAVIVMVYVGGMAIWGGVLDYFGAFISYTAFIAAPISSILSVKLFLVDKQKVSIRKLYTPGGRKKFNVVGAACMALGFLAGAIVYNPATGEILNPLFYYTTASGLSFIVGGLSYYIASRIPGLRALMVSVK